MYKFEPDIGMIFRELPDHARKPLGRRAVEGSDPYQSHLLAVYLSYNFFKALLGVEHIHYIRHDYLTLGGQPYTCPVSFKKRDIQLLLQAVYHPAQSRLSISHLFCCS